jgi:hypothetical protein
VGRDAHPAIQTIQTMAHSIELFFFTVLSFISRQYLYSFFKEMSIREVAKARNPRIPGFTKYG